MTDQVQPLLEIGAEAVWVNGNHTTESGERQYWIIDYGVVERTYKDGGVAVRMEVSGKLQRFSEYGRAWGKNAKGELFPVGKDLQWSTLFEFGMSMDQVRERRKAQRELAAKRQAEWDAKREEERKANQAKQAEKEAKRQAARENFWRLFEPIWNQANGRLIEVFTDTDGEPSVVYYRTFVVDDNSRYGQGHKAVVTVVYSWRIDWRSISRDKRCWTVRANRVSFDGSPSGWKAEGDTLKDALISALGWNTPSEAEMFTLM